MAVTSSWQYYGQNWGACSFLPLQLSSNREVCFLWSLFQNILMQHEPMKCTLCKLILKFNFWCLLHVLNLLGSFSGWFEICRKCQILKNWIKVLIWKVCISFKLHNYITMHGAKNKSQNILLTVQLTGTLLCVCKHWIAQNSQRNAVCNDPVAWNREKCI